MTPPLRRVTLSRPEHLRAVSEALKEHDYTPWSFWLDDDICVQFHAAKDADLSFLRTYVVEHLEGQ